MKYARVTLQNPGNDNTYEDNVPNAVRSDTEAEVVFFYDEDDRIVGAFSDKIWLATIFEDDGDVEETGPSVYDLHKEALNKGFGNFTEAFADNIISWAEGLKR